MSKYQPLRVMVRGEELQIRIGLKTLQKAAEEGEAFNPFSDRAGDFYRAFKITDIKKFAKGVAQFLEDESPDDGSTGLTRLFDEGFVYAIENDNGVDQLPEPPDPEEKTNDNV